MSESERLPEFVIREGGEVVGRVRFDPYEYEYDGDEETVEDYLDGAGEMKAMTGGRTEEGEYVDKAEEMAPRQRAQMVRNKLEYEFDAVTVEGVTDGGSGRVITELETQHKGVKAIRSAVEQGDSYNVQFKIASAYEDFPVEVSVRQSLGGVPDWQRTTTFLSVSDVADDWLIDPDREVVEYRGVVEPVDSVDVTVVIEDIDGFNLEPHDVEVLEAVDDFEPGPEKDHAVTVYRDGFAMEKALFGPASGEQAVTYEIRSHRPEQARFTLGESFEHLPNWDERVRFPGEFDAENWDPHPDSPFLYYSNDVFPGGIVRTGYRVEGGRGGGEVLEPPQLLEAEPIDTVIDAGRDDVRIVGQQSVHRDGVKVTKLIVEPTAANLDRYGVTYDIESTRQTPVDVVVEDYFDASDWRTRVTLDGREQSWTAGEESLQFHDRLPAGGSMSGGYRIETPQFPPRPIGRVAVDQ